MEIYEKTKKEIELEKQISSLREQLDIERYKNKIDNAHKIKKYIGKCFVKYSHDYGDEGSRVIIKF